MNEAAEQRLKRIVENIRTETAFDHQYSDPVSLNDRMAQLHTPAVSIAIIDNFSIAATGTLGTREAGKCLPVTANTRFLAGSISKPVFASAIMYLVQAGELDLDRDINHYLSSWKVPANNGWQPCITLRHLLSHTAGLTVHGFPGYQTNEALPTICQILNGERPANTEKVEANILPGLQFRYSGGGTTIAQLALTDYYNETFQALIKRLVFEPLGMKDSTFENPLPPDAVSSAAVAHPSKSIPLRGNHHIYPESAAAGLWTTAADLACFGLSLQKGLHGQKTSFLNKATVEAMLSPQLAHEKDSSDYVGLGFFCEGKDEQAVFAHSGWDEGFVAELMLYKHAGRGAVVMINSNEGHSLIEEIMRAIADEFDWPAKNIKKSAIQIEDLQIYAGQYTADKSPVFNIDCREDGLLLQYDVQPPVNFKALSKTTFSSQTLNTELSFEFDDDGVVTNLVVEQAGKRFNAKKCQ